MGRKITLTIIVEHTGRRIQLEDLDEDFRAGDLLGFVADKVNVPAETNAVLIRRSTRKQLLLHQTLKAIGIKKDEVLIADFERTAGGSISFHENGIPKEIEFTPEETSSIVEILRESRIIQNEYVLSLRRDIGFFARIILKFQGIFQGFENHQDTNNADVQKLLRDQVLSSIHRQLIIHRNNLIYLEEQLAKYGHMDAPLYLFNRIDGEKAEIQRLERQLKDLVDD